MLAAAIGYFPFTYFFLRCVDYDRATVLGWSAYGFIALAYVAILFPSSLWLPLTARMVQSPSDFLWLLIRVDLFLVALGSLGLVVAAATVEPVTAAAVRVAALIGLTFFCLQRVALDALIWPAMVPEVASPRSRPAGGLPIHRAVCHRRRDEPGAR